MSKKIVKVIGNWVCFYSIQLFLILLNYFYHSILFIYYYKSTVSLIIKYKDCVY